MNPNAFAGDRGEADPIALVIASVLFVASSVAVSSLLVLGLASSAQAQQQTENVQAMAAAVTEFEAQPYASHAVEPATQVELTAGKRDIQVWRQVTQTADGVFHLSLAAPGPVAPGRSAPDCRSALTRHVPGCLTLAGVAAPSVLDVEPPMPTGLAIDVQTAGRGVTLARIDPALLTQAGALELRIGILPAGDALVDDWRAAVVCNDVTPSPAVPDSRIARAVTDSPWLSARVSVPAVDQLAVCPSPSLRLWSTVAAAEPTTADIEEVRAWRAVSG